MRRILRRRTAEVRREKRQTSRPYIGAGLLEAAHRLVDELHHLHCLPVTLNYTQTRASCLHAAWERGDAHVWAAARPTAGMVGVIAARGGGCQRLRACKQSSCNPRAAREERTPVKPVVLTQGRSKRCRGVLAAVEPGRAATTASPAAAGDDIARPGLGPDAPSLCLVILGLCARSIPPTVAPPRAEPGTRERVLRAF